MSHTYATLVIVYVAVAISLAYVPEEDQESLAEVISLLMPIVVFAVSVDEIWGYEIVVDWKCCFEIVSWHHALTFHLCDFIVQGI